MLSAQFSVIPKKLWDFNRDFEAQIVEEQNNVSLKVPDLIDFDELTQKDSTRKIAKKIIGSWA